MIRFLMKVEEGLKQFKALQYVLDTYGLELVAAACADPANLDKALATMDPKIIKSFALSHQPSVAVLREEAKMLKVPYYSRMNREDLVRILHAKETQRSNCEAKISGAGRPAETNNGQG